MPNYDDLFTGQTTQQEEKPFDKTAWAARKQAEREGVYAMIDSYVQDIIAAVTSKANVKAKLPTHYYLDAGNGLVQPSLVLLEQIRTVDKRRLSGYIGRLDEEHIRGINHALAISIGLSEPVPPKLTLCLCDACADAFRGTGAFVLREAAQGQAEEKVCVYCGQYPGIEYVVTPKGGAGV